MRSLAAGSGEEPGQVAGSHSFLLQSMTLNKPLCLSGPQCPQQQNEGAEQIISVAPGTSVSTSIRDSIRRGKAEE